MYKKAGSIYGVLSYSRCVGAALVISVVLASTVLAIEQGGYKNPDFIVTTQWLQENMNDPKIKILDRQDVEPEETYYAEGHIPNSIRMTTDAIKGLRLGIQEMLVVKDLIKYLEQNGISPDDPIVIVSRSDRFPAATRVFWALELLGHKKAAVLDGGIDKWVAEKRPMTKDIPKVKNSTYKVNLQRQKLMTGDELAGYIGAFDELGIVVADSRRPEEYAGSKMSRASDKLGRIPGATGLFFMSILTGENNKEFKSAEDIKKVFDAHKITPDKISVFSCVSGCFGTVLYFGARLLDYDKAAVYDGGWIEWSRKDYPVEGAEVNMDNPKEPPKVTVPQMKKPSAPSQGC